MMLCCYAKILLVAEYISEEFLAAVVCLFSRKWCCTLGEMTAYRVLGWLVDPFNPANNILDIPFLPVGNPHLAFSSQKGLVENFHETFAWKKKQGEVSPGHRCFVETQTGREG